MVVRELPNTEWESFLESFTLQHDHWLVSVERLRDGNRHVAAKDQPLEGVAAHLRASGPREIVITVGGSAESHERFSVGEPTRVRVESDGGVDTGLQIEDGAGAITRVAFRSPIAPELVDGVM